MVLQVRDYREDWPLTVTQPVAGNYYPVIFLTTFRHDTKKYTNILGIT